MNGARSTTPSVTQRFAQYSTITLTMDWYTHMLAQDQRDALEALPDLTPQHQNHVVTTQAGCVSFLAGL